MAANPDPSPLPLLVWSGPLLAGAAGIAGAVPARWGALAAAGLALAAAAALLFLRPPRPLWRLAPLCLALLAAVAAVPEILPLPAPPELLVRGAAGLEANWAAGMARLGRAVDPPPTPGGDFSWLHDRRQALGPQAGAVLFDFPSLDVVAWSGWTTLLSPAEEETLVRQLPAGPAVIVLRRGLAVRLALARTSPDRKSALLAEIPLPPEPGLGPLERGLGGAVLAMVRWESLGEGLRAPLGREPRGDASTDYWSMIPLMAGKSVAGRVTLGVLTDPALRAGQAAMRSTLCAAGLAALLLFLAFTVHRRPWVFVLASRAALAWGVTWPAALERHGLQAALHGVTLLLLLLLVPLPVSPRGRRWSGAAGAALLLLGTGLAAWATAAFEWGPQELLGMGAGELWPILTLVVALASLPAAGAWLLAQALLPGRWSAPFVAVILGGLLAGIGHGVALAPAARRSMERALIPEIAGRRLLWETALHGTLQGVVPKGGEELLAAERDAIDVWWNSPLARRGLASGIWKLGPDGRLEDLFLTGLPPADVPRALAQRGGDEGRPIALQMKFLGGEFQVLAQRAPRAGGGAWVAAVLDEPGNLPSRNLRDPLRGTREADLAPEGAVQAFDVRLAWSDPSGRILHSDLTSSFPRLSVPPAVPAWRTVPVGTRRVELLDIPDPGGVITAIVFPPGLLARASIALSWGLVLGLLVAALTLLRGLAADPRRFFLRAAAAIRLVGDRFRVQVGIALVAAGLLPLLVLGLSGRTVARQQAASWLNAEGARAALVAQRFLDDFFALEPGQGGTIDDGVAAWMARTLGDDVFTWSEGLLLATSRPDLERAGLLPGRLEGSLWEELASGRSTLAMGEYPGGEAGLEPAWSVVHGTFRGRGSSPGVVSVGLGRAGQRIGRGLVQVDRALLVSAALLIALTAWLLRHATGRLVRPLAQLQEATLQIQRGRFQTPVPEGGFEETRSLALAFQDMAASLALQQEALARRREIIERLIASMPVAVLALTEDGTVWAANPRAAQLCGARPGEHLDRGQGVLASAAHRLLEEGREAKQAVEAALEGHLRQFRLSALPLPQHSGKDPDRLLVIEDLTDSLRSERLTAWAEMARRIAHEIKNPLTPISLVVEHARQLMKDGDPELPLTLERCLGMIADQVKVLRDTAAEFSDYARMFQARPEPADLPRLLGEWLAPYALSFKGPVRLVVEGPPCLPEVKVDPRLLRRAVINLLDNALAAVAPAGEVRVTWFAEEGPGGRVGIAVRDNGPGLGPAQEARLFEPGATTRETGSGLGLPIARQAVEAQGGTIEVATSPSAGTCFTILLPPALPAS